MSQTLPSSLKEICNQAEDLAETVLAPKAAEVDATGRWPEDSMRALAEAGLTGLVVPAELGGYGHGLLGVAYVAEILGKACSSSALCFGMHCVATAVIAAKATDYQKEHYLKPIAEGEHLTTLALAEAGTGATFFVAETAVERNDSAFVVNGEKKFVASGRLADSYVISTLSTGGSAAGEFDCFIIDRDLPGMHWSDRSFGFGMRGNALRSLTLHNVKIPLENLVGQEGEQPWYLFQIIAPFCLTAMAGTFLGIAQKAFDLMVGHLKERQYSPSGKSLSEFQVIQHRVGELWANIEKSRLLLYRAANAADMGDPDAMAAVLACKADVADTVVKVTNEAMTLCGGIAYDENSTLARLVRDARASHVIAPTTDMLRMWTGRTILDVPLL